MGLDTLYVYTRREASPTTTAVVERKLPVPVLLEFDQTECRVYAGQLVPATSTNDRGMRTAL